MTNWQVGDQVLVGFPSKQGRVAGLSKTHVKVEDRDGYITQWPLSAPEIVGFPKLLSDPIEPLAPAKTQPPSEQEAATIERDYWVLHFTGQILAHAGFAVDPSLAAQRALVTWWAVQATLYQEDPNGR